MQHQDSPAIIILGHGSRVADACKNVALVAQRLKEKYHYPIVDYCFMSRLGPYFPETLENVVAQGAKKIVVLPYFLSDGLHIVLDIPEMLQKEARRYPDVSLVLGKNLGFDDLLVDLLHKRLTESLNVDDIRNYQLPDRDAFPIPAGQDECVPMKPDKAERYHRTHGSKPDRD